MTDQTNTPPQDAEKAPLEGEQTTEGTPALSGYDEAVLAERRDEQKAATADQGVLHDAGLLDKDADGYLGAQTLQEAAKAAGKARKGDTGYEAPANTSLATAPPTVKDQKAPRLQGKHNQQGYVGTLPGGEDREDLTLAAVLKRDYPTTEEN